MRQVMWRTSAAVALGLCLISLPVLADDTSPSPMRQAPPKPPTFPGYVYVTDVVGEVVSANDKSIKLRITWFQTQAQKGGNNRGRRPNLGRNNRNFRNPFMPNRNRPRVTVKQVHHDYDLDFLPESLVRVKKLPPKTDDNGKRVQYTQKEYDEMRQPVGVTGYAASPFDLTPGTIVEVILIRDKTIPAAKATEGDLRIKYAIIWGKDPNPAKDILNPPSSKNTKNNKKKKN